LTVPRERNSKARCDECEYGLLAGGMNLKTCATPKERREEFSLRLTFVPSLDQNGLLPERGPRNALTTREGVIAREHSDKSFAIDWERGSVGPERETRHESDI